MATRIPFHSLPHTASSRARSGCRNVLRSLALLIGLLLNCIPARSQLQQAFVFAADPANPKSIDVYTRNDLTGVLTPVPGSPFPSKEPVNVMALDFKGRFLFTGSDNPSNISMFSVDTNSGPARGSQFAVCFRLHKPTGVTLHGKQRPVSLCHRL